MADCQRIDALVTPFIDGQLPGDDRRAVEEHLRVCAPCHSRVIAEQAVHDLIRARCHALDASAPGPLREKCIEMARLSLGDAAHPAAHPRSLVFDRRAAHVSRTARVAPFALAASLVLVVGGAFMYQATAQSARVLAVELT